MSPENIAQRSSDHVTSQKDCLSRYLLELITFTMVSLFEQVPSRTDLLTLTCFNHTDLSRGPASITHRPASITHRPASITRHAVLIMMMDDNTLTCFNHTDLSRGPASITQRPASITRTCSNISDLLQHFNWDFS